MLGADWLLFLGPNLRHPAFEPLPYEVKRQATDQGDSDHRKARALAKARLRKSGKWGGWFGFPRSK